MKRVLIGAGVAASVLMAGLVAAQPYGMGPGMMNNYGPDASYGMGPWSMAGPGGHGMGPGMAGALGADVGRHVRAVGRDRVGVAVDRTPRTRTPPST